VTEVARYDPVVLVPTHRSYFDFLIVSSLFYRRHMLPPHIAARENMAFGPFGFLWRRAGAFFLRRSFADPLYKEVFRTYVAYLIKEGFTQEFFIEGGRSRTGKTLPPRLGVLVVGRRGVPGQRPARLCSCRSRSPTSGSSKRARWWASSRAPRRKTRACCA
jgi:glycerol-3-phosphate O-acyltransferase